MSRSVLVTGGNRGIGQAIAAAFVANGDQVAVTYRSGEPPEGVLARASATSPTRRPSTPRSPRSRPRTARSRCWSPTPGSPQDTLVLRMSEEDWSRVIETNLTGSFRVAKRAAKGMLRLRRGRLIFISSVVGLLGSAGQVNYAASKAGLVGMARSLARELGSRVDHRQRGGPGLRGDRDDRRAPRGAAGEVQGADPARPLRLRRGGRRVVQWLASDGAAYVTGAVIPVDGGLGMGH